MRCRYGCTASLLLAAVSAPVSAAAADRYVATTGRDARGCADPADPCRSIGFALGEAGPGDTIQVAAGTYDETLGIDQAVTIIGAGEQATTIDGNFAGTVVTVAGSGFVVLRDLALVHGLSAADRRGGGVTNRADLLLHRVLVANNRVTRSGSATSAGGGIFNDGGSVELDEATVSDNTVSHLGDGRCDGAGVYNLGGLIGLTRSRLHGNRIDGPTTGYHRCRGAGLINLAGGTALLIDSEVAGNEGAGYGAGLFNDDAGVLQVVRSEVTGNVATDPAAGDGGGIYNRGSLRVQDSRFVGNGCGAGRGAGVFNVGAANITRTTIADGAAGRGAGVYNAAILSLRDAAVTGNTTTEVGAGVYNSGQLHLTNTTVSGNAGLRVAGAGVYHRDGIATLSAVTVTDNECGTPLSVCSGAGIYVDFRAELRLGDSIVAGNRIAAIGVGPDCAGELVSDGYNLLGDGAGCTLVGDLTGTLVGVDPLLEPLALRGGATAVHGLGPGSPAVDAGNPASALSFDQRGQPRPVDGDCDLTARADIGAFEVQSCFRPTVYESTDPRVIVTPANAVGTAFASPHPHTPAAAPLLYYQVDDGAGLPQHILMVADAPPAGGVQIYF